MDKRKLIKIERTSNRGFSCLVKCLNCDREFRVVKWEYDNLKRGSFCSNKCRGEIQKIILKGEKNPNWKGGLVEITCIICGKKKEIKVKDTKNGHGKYCSRECTDKDKSRVMKENYRKHPEIRKKVGSPGKLNPRYGKSSAHGKGNWYIRKDGTKVWMRSSYEIAFAKWLDNRGLTWKYEPKRFYLKDRTYAPDFQIKEWKSWIEIKGWFHERHQETIKQFREYNSNENMLVLTKPLLKAMSVL